MRVNIVNQASDAGGGFNIAGATMTGPLLLAADPVGVLEATTKKYVDNAVSSLNAGHITTGTLPVGRLPAFTGDFTSVVGTNTLTLNNTSVTPGTYTKVTVDAKGRVTAGASLSLTDIPALDWTKVVNNKPTTVAGYNISDAVKSTSDVMTGPLSVHANPTLSTHAANKAYVDAQVSASSSLATGDTVRRTNTATPSGFLRCNGGVVSRSTYSALFAVIKGSYSTSLTLDYTSYAAMGAGRPWSQQYDFKNASAVDITDWKLSNSTLPVGSPYGVVAVTANRVYVIGDTGSSTSVYSASINADGSLSGWGTEANALPAPIVYGNLVATKNRLFAINGQNSAAVYTAVINADGSLGAWTTTNPLPQMATRSSVMVTKNRMYVLGGGDSGASAYNVIYSAPINTDGTIGAWVTESNTLPGARAFTALVATRNRVYLLGGWDGSVRTTTIYWALINSDGTLGGWTAQGTGLPISVSQHSVAVTRNRVFLFGGTSNGQSLNTVYTCAINADGTLGTWTAATNLPTTMYSMGVVVAKDKVHLIGGGYNSGSIGYLSSVYTGTLTGADSFNDYTQFYNGTINKFDGTNISGTLVTSDTYDNSQTTMLPGAGMPWRNLNGVSTSGAGDSASVFAQSASGIVQTLYKPATFVTKNIAHVFGSYQSAGTSGGAAGHYTAPINADGSVGAWTKKTADTITSAYGARAIVTKNRVYMIGGYGGTSTGFPVFTAPILPNGDTDVFTLVGYFGTAPMVDAEVFVTSNRVYLVGGQNMADTSNPVASNKVFTALINSDGTLGAWAETTPLPNAIYLSVSAVTKNRVYLFGGMMGSGAGSTNIYTAPINTDGTLGTWVTAGSIPWTGNTTNQYMPVTVTKSGVHVWTNFCAYRYFAPINADGTIGSWALFTANNVIGGSTYSIYGEFFMTSNKMHVILNNNTAFYTTINTGLNDYTACYDGSLIAASSTTFTLPDTTATDPTNIYTFIKY